MDRARIRLFVQAFMESMASTTFTFLACKTEEQAMGVYEEGVLKGLVVVDNCLCKHGGDGRRSGGENDDGEGYFLGGQTRSPRP